MWNKSFIDNNSVVCHTFPHTIIKYFLLFRPATCIPVVKILKANQIEKFSRSSEISDNKYFQASYFLTLSAEKKLPEPKSPTMLKHEEGSTISGKRCRNKYFV